MWLALVVSLGWIFSGSALSAAQPATLEYEVKAAFVLNFIRYVEWPPKMRTPPFRLCVLRQNPFGGRLEAMVSGEQWQGGAVEVRVVPTTARAAGCHLLYVPASAAARFTRDAARLANTPVLTVGEHPEFLQRGGMIRLFVEDQEVRFSVNQKAATSSGLQISSRLLRLARSVIGAPGS